MLIGKWNELTTGWLSWWKILVLLGIAAAIVYSAWPAARVPPTSQNEGPVIASVNQSPIYLSELNQAIAEYLRTSDSQEVTVQDQKQLVHNLIFRRVILQRPEVETIRSQPVFKERLQKVENDLVVSHFLSDRLNSKLKSSEEELLAYYNKNKNQFVVGPKLEARVMLLRSAEEAQSIQARIKGGEKFEDLAAAYSIDLPSAKKGGSLGVVERSATPPDIWKELVRMGEGEVRGVIETKFGFNLLKLDRIVEPESFQTFESVKPNIRQFLAAEKREKAHDELRAEIMKDAKISVYEERFLKPPPRSSN